MTSPDPSVATDLAGEERAASDARLIDMVRRGNRAAYGELVHRYENKLKRTIYRMVGNLQTSEDLTQEAFLKAYDRLSDFDVSRRFGPWLFQIGVNGAVDWLRRSRKRAAVSLHQVRPDGSALEIPVDDARDHLDLSQEVQHVLAKIPLQYRTVLTLRDLEGFSTSEVAAIVGREDATVRWRLGKAREMFREIWERREGVRT